MERTFQICCNVLIGLIMSPLIFLCSCSKHADYTYRITDLQIYNVDNAVDSVREVIDSVRAKAYVIKMKYSSEIYGSTEGTQYQESARVLGNKVANFTIYSLTDFDSTHPALSSLNEYFLYGWATIKDLLSTGYLLRVQYPFGEKEPSIGRDSANLQMMVLPTVLGKRQFVVEAVFADSTRLSDTTSVSLF